MLSNVKHLATALTLCCLFLSGCSSIITATTSEPIRPDPTKRTFGVHIDDENIETIARVNLNKAHPALKGSNISVVSFNGIVLLTGQVNNQEMRQLASDTVLKLHRVRQVFNELEVGKPTTIWSASNDALITSNIKSQLLFRRGIKSSRIKVITENGTVYLMGILTKIQAEKAANIASMSSGVRRVVKAVEYID